MRFILSVSASLFALAAISAPSHWNDAKAQNGGVINLDTIVVRGDKVGRDTRESTAGTTVITGEEASVAGNNDIDDVIDAEPNVLAPEGIQIPAIRGIDGSGGQRQAFSAGTQARVPILIDDVARPLSNASAISKSTTWDINTVEVARGPQPTSTGRNAFGGAIRIYTNDPVFDLEAAAKGRYFNERGTLDGAFMLNVPLVEDELAVRFTAEGSDGKSYINIKSVVPNGNDLNEEKSLRLRGKLLYQPKALAGTSFLLIVDHIENSGPIQGFYTGSIKDLQITGPTPFSFVSSLENNEQTTYTAKSTIALNDNFTWVSRFSYLENVLRFPDVGEGLGLTGFDQDQIEVESYLQFENLGLIRRGVLGVIHNTEKEDGFNVNSAFFSFRSDGEINNTGIYGEVEISLDALVSGLTFIGGARVEIDKRRRIAESPTGTVASIADTNEVVVLPKLGLRYEVDSLTSLGYTFSQGFRGGGVDVDLPANFFGLPFVATAPFGPEYIDQHEIYVKSTVLDNRLDIGATAFFYKWTDAQVNGANNVMGVALFGNIPEAIGYGGELNAKFRVTPEVTINGALGLLDTEITDAGAALAAFKGSELPRAPNVTVSGGVQWAPGNGFTTAANVRHIGATNSALTDPVISSYTVVDLRAGYEFDVGSVGRLRLEAFVDNIFDKRYQTFRENNPGLPLNAAGRPRTFGVSLTGRL